MANQEFQELKKEYRELAAKMSDIIEQMKTNLTHRNNGADEYVFGYTSPGKRVFISKCDFTGLCEIDGDMNQKKQSEKIEEENSKIREAMVNKNKYNANRPYVENV